MNTIQIDAKWIKAAVVMAPKADVRYYMVGVLVDVKPRETRIVGTDGHKLLVLCREVPDNEPDQVPAAIIIPGETIKAVKPARNNDCILTYDADKPLAPCTLTMLNGPDLGFTPIDGRYPDYTRIIQVRATSSLEHAHFDFAFFGQFAQAAKVAFDAASNKLEVWPNGESSAPVTLQGHPEFFGVIMPMRGSKEFEMPAWARNTPAEVVQLRKAA